MDSERLSAADAKAYLQGCGSYFQRNPYRAWFDKYEKFINVFGYSYYAGTAVHIDIVQWATNPLWSGLQQKVRIALIEKDSIYFRKQLDRRFKIIFLNGQTVMNYVAKLIEIKDRVDNRIQFRGRNIMTMYGKYNEGTIVGWSPYLQSQSVGGYENIKRLARLLIRHQI